MPGEENVLATAGWGRTDDDVATAKSRLELNAALLMLERTGRQKDAKKKKKKK